MSDVSGIPYMGPQGVGNLYAPLFPASGMSTPSASQISYNWAPQGAYGQNVIDNLYSSGGGFGKQTDYYSQLGANYSAAGMSPWGLFTDAGTMSTGRGAGGAAFPISYNTGYNTGGMGGGGGGALSVNDPSIDWTHLFGGGGGSGGMSSMPSMPSGQSGFDWTHLFSGGGQQSQQMQQPSNFGSLFGQGAGGMYASRPSAADQTAGWGNAPTAMPSSQRLLGYEPQQWPEPQQQPINYGSLFGQGVGGSATDQRAGESTVADPNRATYGGYGQGGATSALPGYMADNKLPADLRPSAAPEPGSRSYDFAPMFEGGGGGGLGTGGAESQLYGGQASSPGGNAFTYNPYSTGAGGGFEQSAESKAEQGRASLASLIGGPSVEQQTAEYRKAQAEAEKAAEAPVVAGDEAVPLPRERPAGAAAAPPTGPDPATDVYPGANPPRPPADIPLPSLAKEAIRRGVNPRLAAAVEGGATFLPPGYHVEVTSGAREGAGQSQHRGGHAMDIRIVGPDGAIRNRGDDDSGMYTLLARGVKTWVTQNDPQTASQMRYGGAFGTNTAARGGGGVPDLMHYDLGSYIGYGNMRPEVGFNRLQPLTAEERNAMPAYIPELGANQVPLDAPGARPIGAASAAIPPPAAQSDGGFNFLDAAANAPRPPADIPAPAVPKGPSDVQKAQTFLNRSVESILQERAPQHLTAAGFAMDIKQPLREALKGPYGDQILSGIQPKLGEVGLTREAFAKAVADPRARFGGGFGGEEFRGEMPTAGSFTPFPGWRESADFENQSTDVTPMGLALGLNDIGGPAAAGLDPSWAKDVAIPDTSLGRALGLQDIEAPSMRDFQSPANDYSMFQQPATRADLAQKMDFSGFSPSPEPRQGGVGPPIEMTPEHMRTMEEIESHQNPRLHDKGSSYKGLYQLDDTEFRKYGGTGSIFNAEQNTKAATAKMYAEGQRAQDILGRALTPVEQYMVHQQGLAGTLSHLANPDQPAWKSFQQASQWSDARAKTAIWGNLSNDQKAQFGNDVNSITSRDFINLWTTMYYQKMVASGLSPGGLSDLPQ